MLSPPSPPYRFTVANLVAMKWSKAWTKGKRYYHENLTIKEQNEPHMLHLQIFF